MEYWFPHGLYSELCDSAGYELFIVGKAQNNWSWIPFQLKKWKNVSTLIVFLSKIISSVTNAHLPALTLPTSLILLQAIWILAKLHPVHYVLQ